MLNMSFAMNVQQIRDGTKTVTRRMGWGQLRPGFVLMACVKCQGIPKHGRVERIRPIRVVSFRKERLDQITPEEVLKEGFVGMTTGEFVELFCEANHCKPDAIVNRILFEYVDATP